MQQKNYKTILLICGFGYGTTAVVKDALRNGYQIYVKDCIPAYKVQQYGKWDEIDIVLSTVKVELPVEKPFAQINVIFEKEDYVKLDLLGIRRKNVLADYFAIEKRLDFLDEEDRKRVVDIIKEELGYKEVRTPAIYHKLSDLLGADNICCKPGVENWHEAVRCCTEILQDRGCITEAYHDNIIQGMEVQGFYAVTEGMFALLHGNETAGVKVSCMSLLVTEKPICFGDKKVNIVFCLASRDKKEHIPAVTRLMRMVLKTDFIQRLGKCTDKAEAWKVIKDCEKEVEVCYQ